VLGGANTVATTIAFFLLALVLSPRIAFTLVYLAGLAFVVIATPRYVFGTRASWPRRALLALWYLGTYAIGIGVVSLLDEVLAAPRAVVVLGTVMVTAPLGFVGGRLLVAGRGLEGMGETRQ
jgi:inner membrane protein involved in colicin E2 resistance